MCVSTLSFGFYYILSLCRLGFTMLGEVISRFKIGFEFIKVQVNGSMYLTVRKNLSALLDYTGL